jgi:hypothetical protein
MDDKSLLEMAAKAAGMTGWKFTGTSMAKMLDPSNPETTGSVGRNWSPLTDDGDALRLAVRLGMGIDVLHGSGISLAYVHGKTQARVTHGGDADSATRRAIVRAAAKIVGELP